jgi:hypothetical protein
MTSEPVSVRSVRFPAAYGTPGGPDSLRSWSYVEERLRAASNYWITTVGPRARPHARPVDGVWVDGALCFGGSPETRWVRNLMDATTRNGGGAAWRLGSRHADSPFGRPKRASDRKLSQH